MQEKGPAAVARVAHFDSPGAHRRFQSPFALMVVLCRRFERMPPGFLARTAAGDDLGFLGQQGVQKHPRSAMRKNLRVAVGLRQAQPCQVVLLTHWLGGHVEEEMPREVGPGGLYAIEDDEELAVSPQIEELPRYFAGLVLGCSLS